MADPAEHKAELPAADLDTLVQTVQSQIKTYLSSKNLLLTVYDTRPLVEVENIKDETIINEIIADMYTRCKLADLKDLIRDQKDVGKPGSETLAELLAKKKLGKNQQKRLDQLQAVYGNFPRKYGFDPAVDTKRVEKIGKTPEPPYDAFLEIQELQNLLETGMKDRKKTFETLHVCWNMKPQLERRWNRTLRGFAFTFAPKRKNLHIRNAKTGDATVVLDQSIFLDDICSDKDDVLDPQGAMLPMGKLLILSVILHHKMVNENEQYKNGMTLDISKFGEKGHERPIPETYAFYRNFGFEPIGWTTEAPVPDFKWQISDSKAADIAKLSKKEADKAKKDIDDDIEVKNAEHRMWLQPPSFNNVQKMIQQLLASDKEDPNEKADRELFKHELKPYADYRKHVLDKTKTNPNASFAQALARTFVHSRDGQFDAAADILAVSKWKDRVLATLSKTNKISKQNFKTMYPKLARDGFIILKPGEDVAELEAKAAKRKAEIKKPATPAVSTAPVPTSAFPSAAAPTAPPTTSAPTVPTTVTGPTTATTPVTASKETKGAETFEAKPGLLRLPHAFGQKWAKTLDALKRPVKTADDLVALFGDMHAKKYEKEARNLANSVSTNWVGPAKDRFWNQILPHIQLHARRIEHVLPAYLELLPSTGMSETRHLTVQQVASLLACAFFCLYEDRATDSVPRKKAYVSTSEPNWPTVNFNYLFNKLESVFDPDKEKWNKLLFFLKYFDVVSQELESAGSRPRIVSVHRHVLQPTESGNFSGNELKANNNVVTRLVREPLQKTIEDVETLYGPKGSRPKDWPTQYLQVDFANKFIGGGVLADGASQEETRFLSHPECVVASLLCQQLQDHESVTILGAMHIADYEGANETLKFHERKSLDQNVATLHFTRVPLIERSFADVTLTNVVYTDANRLNRAIVAIDARDYRGVLKPSDQWFPTEVQREVQKAFAGFSVPAQVLGNTDEWGIATGAWGASTYRGNAMLKGIIQLMAASMSQRPVVYFPFAETRTEKLPVLANHMHKNGTTVGQLYSAVHAYVTEPGIERRDPAGHAGFYDYIANQLFDGQSVHDLETAPPVPQPMTERKRQEIERARERKKQDEKKAMEAAHLLGLGEMAVAEPELEVEKEEVELEAEKELETQLEEPELEAEIKLEKEEPEQKEPVPQPPPKTQAIVQTVQVVTTSDFWASVFKDPVIADSRIIQMALLRKHVDLVLNLVDPLEMTADELPNYVELIRSVVLPSFGYKFLARLCENANLHDYVRRTFGQAVDDWLNLPYEVALEQFIDAELDRLATFTDALNERYALEQQKLEQPGLVMTDISLVAHRSSLQPLQQHDLQAYLRQHLRFNEIADRHADVAMLKRLENKPRGPSKRLHWFSAAFWGALSALNVRMEGARPTLDDATSFKRLIKNRRDDWIHFVTVLARHLHSPPPSTAALLTLFKH